MSHQSAPAPLTGAKAGTWAHDTIRRRLPEIVQWVMAENEFSPAVNQALARLQADLPDGVIRPLAAGGDAWNHYVAPYEGQTWLEVPWFFAETYFYRRILEATGYFEDEADPFANRKRKGLMAARPSMRQLCTQLNQYLQQQQDGFLSLLQVDLWGNQADLSLWDSDTVNYESASTGTTRTPLLVDDAVVVAHHLRLPVPRVDFIVDNAGFELVCDLCLVDFLLSSQRVEQIYLHLKAHPTFVSDATLMDMAQTIPFLIADVDEAVWTMGRRLGDYWENGRLRLQAHPFWTSPLAMWQMPADLGQLLSQADLIISKGDANYRRLLGDRQWSFTTPFAEVVHYMPAPLAALRTLKSELVVGLQPGQAEALTQQDADWLTNGRWGLIQFWA